MPSLLILSLVLGAIGLFLVMPGGRTGRARVGLVTLAAAGGALAAGLCAGQDGRGLFAGCALVALFAAVRVITHKRPVYSALYFVLLVVAVAALLLLMDAEFLAAALIIIYAGAILVTYIFVIMLAQQSRPAPYDAKAREPFWGCLAGFALLALLAVRLFSGTAAMPATVLAGTVEGVGTRLLTEYVIGIQLAGLLLLAALVGAIAIARRRPANETLPEGDE
ncbi:MAG TPA: NADH-quinone oxidoreductase subunit J [Phycisphaerae bacterium]|nr:NADH-quinone oxidoreductase subunit J [Phycisphaerae bacterium]